MANCSMLPGLSSLKIKSDETNLFCVKITKNQLTKPGPPYFFFDTYPGSLLKE